MTGIAEVLAAHQWRGEILGCDCGWNWPGNRTYFCGEDERVQKAHIAHQVEAIAAAGLAVVELPEVVVDEYGDQRVEVPLCGRFGRSGHLRVEPGGENYQGKKLATRIAALGVPTPIEVPDARSFAAALLAAADAAERSAS